MSIVQRVYNATIRDRLPRKWVVYDEIPARDGRLLDITDTVQPYKPGLKKAISSQIQAGDKVTIVGGGRGVSSVWCAQQEATVTAYEAAEEMVPIAKETVRMQSYSDKITVRHALVGEAIEVYGDYSTAEIIPPGELSSGDVLVMDCEGAERSILTGLNDWPTTIIVETHPERGVPTGETRSKLAEHGYSTKSLSYSPDSAEKRVVVGTKEGQS